MKRRRLPNGKSPVRSDSQLPKALTCQQHEWLETFWKNEESSRNPFQSIVRETQSRGRNRKRTVDRMVTPEMSDHCKSQWLQNSVKDSSESEIQNYIVRFRRRYAYVYALMSRPCGIVIDGTFFPDSESPTEVAQFVVRTFPEIDTMPRYIFFDAACKVARAMYPISSRPGKLSSLKEHFQSSHWLVPPIHQRSQKVEDNFCQTYCNAKKFPAVLNEDKTHRFNATICEEIFAQLGKRVAAVRTMRKSFGELYYYLVHEESNLSLMSKKEYRIIDYP